MNALETYNKIVKTLEQSDIVWPKYGSENVEKLAERITRITFPSFTAIDINNG